MQLMRILTPSKIVAEATDAWASIRSEYHFCERAAFWLHFYIRTTISLILIEQSDQLLVLILQVLDDALLLWVFFHEYRGFSLKLFIDWQVLPAICQAVVLLFLLEKVILLLDEDFKAHLLHFLFELIVLHLQILYVRVLHRQLTDFICDFLLLLRQCFFVFFFNALNFLFLCCQFELSLPKLLNQFIIACIVGKFLFCGLLKGLDLDDFGLFCYLIVFVLSLDLSQLIVGLVKPLLQILQLCKFFLRGLLSSSHSWSHSRCSLCWRHLWRLLSFCLLWVETELWVIE